MKKIMRSAAALLPLLSVVTPASCLAADSQELAEVKQMIEQLKSEYEARISELEQRLEKAEEAARKPGHAVETTGEMGQVSPSAAKSSATSSVTSGNAFNPQISVILDGNYYQDGMDGEGAELLGMADGINHSHHDDEHDHGHAHGGAEEGFNFRSMELAFSATVDPYFDASAYLAIDADGGVDLEEAWLQSRNLPYGLRIKAGKFLSDIGYANTQHPHSWQFVDQNLAYLNLLGGHGLQDIGIQLTWLPAWDRYTLFGVEVLQGDQEKLGAMADEDAIHEAAEEIGLDEDLLGLDGSRETPSLYTAFFKYAPELGYDHALQLGAWGAWADQQQEVHEEPVIHALKGDAWMWGLDAVYKYDAGLAYGAGDFSLQSEYLRQEKDLRVSFHEFDANLVGDERKFSEDGIYLQGTYGIAPRWRAALRYDRLGLSTNTLKSDGMTLREWDDSERWTLALSWAPSEFSLFRLQYALADMSIEDHRERFDYLYLQFLLSLGSHGAHKF